MTLCQITAHIIHQAIVSIVRRTRTAAPGARTPAPGFQQVACLGAAAVSRLVTVAVYTHCTAVHVIVQALASLQGPPSRQTRRKVQSRSPVCLPTTVVTVVFHALHSCYGLLIMLVPHRPLGARTAAPTFENCRTVKTMHVTTHVYIYMVPYDSMQKSAQYVNRTCMCRVQFDAANALCYENTSDKGWSKTTCIASDGN